MTRVSEGICEVCGRGNMIEEITKGSVNKICSFCANYHAPTPCTGEGCQVCKEIRFLKDKGTI